MIKKLRINLIRWLIELNEKLFFYRKLSSFYKSVLGSEINVVIDVGANTGQTIDFFLKINPQCEIFSFEPNPWLFEKLKKKYLDHENVLLFELGISDEVGFKVFNENVFHSTSSFENVNMTSKYLSKKSKILGVKPTDIIDKSYSVEVTTLSDFIRNHCSKPIDIIKIDTEGHEFSCIKGLFNSKVKFDVKLIQLESHNDDMYDTNYTPNQVLELLENNGFRVAEKISHGFGEFDEIILSNQSKWNK